MPSYRSLHEQQLRQNRPEFYRELERSGELKAHVARLMRPHFSYLLFQALTLVLGTALAAQAPAGAGAGEVYRATAPSVFLLELRGGTGERMGIGSAFLIQGGRLVTNAHVVSAGEPYIRTGAVALPLTVERLDLDEDLAILRSATLLDVQPLPFADTTLPIGTTIYVLGNPRGLERTISTGLVSGYRQFRGRDLMQITAAVSPGSSGGPVVDERGRVVGVTVGHLEGGQNLNFAVPIARVVALLERAGTPAFTIVPLREAELVTEFLRAANRWDLTRMAELWGESARGPASRYLESADLLDRLIIMAAYLGNDSLRVLAEPIEPSRSRLSVRVLLMRGGAASPIVPFTLEPWREGGLLISDIDLTATGGVYRAPSARPTPAARPQTSLTGSYRGALLTRPVAGGATGASFGALHLGKQVGMLRLPWGSISGGGYPAVWFVRSARRNARGQVAVEIGGTAYDGFQTDSGVYLEQSTIRGTMHSSLIGFLYAPPLSANEGLYRVESRTEYYPARSRRPSGRVTDWTGELAVVVAGDSVWVDMALVNDVGGDTGLRAAGRLTDSQFDLVSRDGERRLTGRLRNGSLVAEWADRRDGARYQGTLLAERF